MKLGYVVQDRSTGEFLAFDAEGILTSVRLLNVANRFSDSESAGLAGLEYCDAGFIIQTVVSGVSYAS